MRILSTTELASTGVGLGFIPSIYRDDFVDQVVSLKDEDAFKWPTTYYERRNFWRDYFWGYCVDRYSAGQEKRLSLLW